MPRSSSTVLMLALVVFAARPPGVWAAEDAGLARAPTGATSGKREGASPRPDAGVPTPSPRGPSAWAPLPAPLGRIGDALLPPGAPVDPLEGVQPIELQGCSKAQQLSLARLLSGVALAGAQIQTWLDAQPEASRGLFSATVGGLASAVARARSATPPRAPVPACLPLEEGWRLAALRVSSKPPCAGAAEPLPPGRLFLFDTSPSSGATRARGPKNRPPAALVFLAATAGERAPDACRARASVVLLDDQGRARLRYHADFGGSLQVELLGDRCRMLRFVLDEGGAVFRPVEAAGGHGCAGKTSAPVP